MARIESILEVIKIRLVNNVSLVKGQVYMKPYQSDPAKVSKETGQRPFLTILPLGFSPDYNQSNNKESVPLTIYGRRDFYVLIEVDPLINDKDADIGLMERIQEQVLFSLHGYKKHTMQFAWVDGGVYIHETDAKLIYAMQFSCSFKINKEHFLAYQESLGVVTPTKINVSYNNEIRKSKSH